MAVPLLELVPHRPPMLLLEQLEHFEPGRATVTGRVREDCPFLLPDGSLDPLACIELLAQGAAAMKGAEGRASGEPMRSGMLVGARDFVFETALQQGEPIRVEVVKGPGHDPLNVASGEIWSGDRRIATGELRVFLGGPAAAPAAEAREAARGSIHPLLPRWGTRTSTDRATFVVEAGFPAFVGHFPGQPVLPAVASAMCGLETLRGVVEGLVLKAVPYAKFARPVTPGESVEVECRRRDDGAFGVTVRSGAAVVADLVMQVEGAQR